MSKERLYEYKKALNFEMLQNISLKTQIKELKRTIRWINEDKDWLENKIKYQDKVLEFYADKENYKEFHDLMRNGNVTLILEDGGTKAREALDGESNE